MTKPGWEIGVARKRDRVVERDARAPVGLRQTIDAQSAAEPATFEDDGTAGQPSQVYGPGNDVRFDPERAAFLFIEPKSMPARLPVVTESQASAVPGAVSAIFRSGLRKFTRAIRAIRSPPSVSLHSHMVSQPRPRFRALPDSLYADVGGLMSYSSGVADQYRQRAAVVTASAAACRLGCARSKGLRGQNGLALVHQLAKGFALDLP